MNKSRLLYLLVVTTATIMKANAEADNHSILANGLSGLRGTYLKPIGKKKKNKSGNVASRGYTDTASLSAEEKTRELDSSCSCEFSDLIGSDFSCFYSSSNIYEIPNFGEEESVWKIVNAEGSQIAYYNFVSSTDSVAIYANPFTSSEHFFRLDPSVEEDGKCLLSGYLITFGCWACPTPSPTFFPTDSPSNQPTEEEDDEINDDIVNTGSDDTEEEEEEEDDDDEDDTAEGDEECCNCSCCLFSSLKKLFLVARVDSIPE